MFAPNMFPNTSLVAVLVLDKIAVISFSSIILAGSIVAAAAVPGSAYTVHANRMRVRVLVLP